MKEKPMHLSQFTAKQIRLAKTLRLQLAKERHKRGFELSPEYEARWNKTSMEQQRGWCCLAVMFKRINP